MALAVLALIWCGGGGVVDGCCRFTRIVCTLGRSNHLFLLAIFWMVLLRPWIPRLPPISSAYLATYIHQCVSAFLNWFNVLQSIVLHVYIFVSQEYFPSQQSSQCQFSWFFTWQQQMALPSVNVSVQVIAKNHLIWFCKLFTNIRGLLFSTLLILRVLSTAMYNE